MATPPSGVQHYIPDQVLGGTGPIPGIALKPKLKVKRAVYTKVSEDGKSLIDDDRMVIDFFWRLEPRTKYRKFFTDFPDTLADQYNETIEDNSQNPNHKWIGAQQVDPFDPPRPHWPMVIPIE